MGWVESGFGFGKDPTRNNGVRGTLVRETKSREASYGYSDYGD
jgi:hypothetical protein